MWLTNDKQEKIIQCLDLCYETCKYCMHLWCRNSASKGRSVHKQCTVEKKEPELFMFIFPCVETRASYLYFAVCFLTKHILYCLDTFLEWLLCCSYCVYFQVPPHLPICSHSCTIQLYVCIYALCRNRFNSSQLKGVCHQNEYCIYM